MKLDLRIPAMICLALPFISPAYSQDPGADTYQAKCKMCHGADGLGNTPAGRLAKIVSFKDPSVVNASDGDLVPIIRNGKNKMPAFVGKLSDDQITAVLTYIRALQK